MDKEFEKSTGMELTSGDNYEPGEYERDEFGEKAERVLDSVEEYVRERWHRALEHKQTIQTELLQCLRQRKGVFDPHEACVDGVDVYMNISSKEGRTIEAWIKDVFGTNTEKPWTLHHTPVVTLSDVSKKLVVEQVRKMISPEILSNPAVFKTPTMRELVKNLKNTAAIYENRIAADAAARMSLKIEDQLVEGGFREAFTGALTDLATFPCMILKSPVFRMKKRLKWTGNKVSVVEETVLATERISPFDLYPSPSSATPADSYICEVMHFEQSQLYDCKKMPHFNSEKLCYAMDQHPDGFKLQDWNDVERELLEKGGFRAVSARGSYDVIDFWGKVPGKMLAEWGVKLPGGEDAELDAYEVNAWLLDDVCIRCLLNPDPLGDRPYRVSSFEKIPGSFFGNGPMQLIRDIQRVCNAAARNLIRNMAYSAGPIAEVEVGRLADEETFDQIVPFKAYFTSEDSFGGGRQAIRFTVVPSVAGELMAIYEKYESMASSRLGIPRAADGSSGAQPRTIGVFSMQMANASKGIKSVISNLEIDIIEPIVRSFWAHNMIHSDDESIKGDVNIVARGASGLLNAEHMKMRQQEFMGALPPFLPALPKEDVLRLLSQMAKGLDLDFSFTKPGAIQDALESDNFPVGAGGIGGTDGAPGGPPAQPGAPGGALPPGLPSGAPVSPEGVGPLTPPPRLDGRQLSQMR